MVEPTHPGVVDPFGRMIGTVVAATFGAVFVLVNTDAFGPGWATTLRGLAIVAAVALVAGAFLTFRHSVRAARGGVSGRPARWGRGYWLVVAGEVVALAAGLWVVNGVLGASEFAVTWVALVVGVHFVVLGRLWRLGLFGTLGAVMVGLAVLAVVLGATTGSVLLIQLLAGVGCGVALFLAGASAVDRGALRSPRA